MLILGGDHIYTMNYAQMLAAHVQAGAGGIGEHVEDIEFRFSRIEIRIARSGGASEMRARELSLTGASSKRALIRGSSGALSTATCRRLEPMR